MTKEKDEIIREMKSIREQKRAIIAEIKQKKREIKTLDKKMNSLIIEITNKVR